MQSLENSKITVLIDTIVLCRAKRLREELDLPEYYILYLFRHTAATNVLEGTSDSYSAQKLLGHDNIKTTSQYYIASNPKQTQKATEYLWNNLKS